MSLLPFPSLSPESPSPPGLLPPPTEKNTTLHTSIHTRSHRRLYAFTPPNRPLRCTHPFPFPGGIGVQRNPILSFFSAPFPFLRAQKAHPDFSSPTSGGLPSTPAAGWEGGGASAARLPSLPACLSPSHNNPNPQPQHNSLHALRSHAKDSPSPRIFPAATFHVASFFCLPPLYSVPSPGLPPARPSVRPSSVRPLFSHTHGAAAATRWAPLMMLSLQSGEAGSEAPTYTRTARPHALAPQPFLFRRRRRARSPSLSLPALLSRRPLRPPPPGPHTPQLSPFLPPFHPSAEPFDQVNKIHPRTPLLFLPRPYQI